MLPKKNILVDSERFYAKNFVGSMNLLHLKQIDQHFMFLPQLLARQVFKKKHSVVSR